MPLRTTAVEHFEKLRRVYERLDSCVYRGDLDDFFKTAYHLIENIEKDPATDASQKAAAKALRSDPEVKLCREIANTQKHRDLNHKRHPSPKILKAFISRGYGAGRYGKGDYGVGEEGVTIQLKDGASQDAFDLATSIFRKFELLFPGH